MRMEVVGDPEQIPSVQAEVADAITSAEGRPRPMVPVERFAFYDLARQAYAVIQTGERRFYGCFHVPQRRHCAVMAGVAGTPVPTLH